MARATDDLPAPPACDAKQDARPGQARLARRLAVTVQRVRDRVGSTL